MQYKPYWKKIIIMSVVLHFIVLSAISLIWSGGDTTKPEDDTQELEWVDVEVADEPAAVDEPEIPEVVEKVPDFEFPPIEFPPLPEPVIEEPPPPPPPIETPPPRPEVKPSDENKGDAEKEKPDDSRGVIKAISKVYPKDVFQTLINTGIIQERPMLGGGKIVVAITIGTDGKVKSVEIRRGGGTDEHGNLINIVSEAAASAWTFEPFLDEDGNPKEIKTQIEFKPEDF